MLTRAARTRLLLICSLFLLHATACAAFERTFSIEEPFGLDWGPDRVSYTVSFPKGEAAPDGVELKDAAGQKVSVQLSAIELWPDGKTLKQALVSFMATLKPSEKRSWTLTAGTEKKNVQVADLPISLVEGDRFSMALQGSDLKLSSDGHAIAFETSKTGIKLLGFSKSFNPPVAADKLPAPIQSVRLPGPANDPKAGKWIGKGWWQTDIACSGYSVKITAAGPVFARAEMRYDFEGGKFYAATVELNAGQDLAVISEEYNLSEGKRYPMSGVNGMKPDVQYGYVYPKFDPPESALIWDWWGQTMAKLPTPDFYAFSFNEGLQPDSAEFHGRSQYNNLLEGDGGLKFDQDGRFAYLNAYLQWGDEESLYLGLYNSKDPAPMLAVVALQPSRWLHPDITPHPDSTLKQYTMTTCLTFERRKNGEAFFRAPVCLGKRVYGIGGMERTLGKHVLNDRGGPKISEKDVWASDIMLRHVRLGRLTLNTLKDWVLAYTEPAKYPRVYVPEGDRVRYESRRTRKTLEETKKDLEARAAPAEADKKCVAEALARTSGLVRHFAQIDKGHMDFGIEEGVYADLAEDALSSPACTPEQNSDLRKWLAAIVYFALHPDFVPPREAGFAWGSANMMSQVQCRACRIAALLPNHPQGKAWRDTLANVVTLLVVSQVNESGVTLECPHYGGMAIGMPALALAALQSCGGTDITRASQRLAAAGHTRLATLLPPDVRGGFRSQCPEGDGYYDCDYTLAVLAGFFQKTNPELAHQLAWGVKENGPNALGGHADSAFKLLDPGFETAAPKLVSEHYLGHGFVMRNGFPRADEAYVQGYAGSFSWGHGHNDRGTWVLYAKGAPLMLDFAAMYTPSMREMWLHPGGLSFNHDETVRPAGDDPKDDWWHKGSDEQYRKTAQAPFTVVEMAPSPASAADLDRMGEVTAFKSVPQADFAEMKRRVSYVHRVPYLLADTHKVDGFNDSLSQEMYLKNPFVWTRRFVFVKDSDPLGHNYLVIRDDLPGNSELDPNLNLWCLADKLEVAGQLARYTGQHGVDLHCYVAEPSSFVSVTRKVGHPCGFGFAQHYKQTFQKDFREDQLLCRIPQQKRDGGYFVALVPVKPGEPAPKFETLAGGKALRVIFPDRTDTVVLRDEKTELVIDGQPVGAASALVTTANGKTTVTGF